MPKDSPTPSALPERLSVTVIIEGEGYRRSETSEAFPREQVYNELGICLNLIRRYMRDYGLPVSQQFTIHDD
jgi:hypothetical protein